MGDNYEYLKSIIISALADNIMFLHLRNNYIDLSLEYEYKIEYLADIIIQEMKERYLQIK